ncbi:MAG: sigma-70 family RNA polymerase sigma factor [Phycisphaerae bacterium]|nr:sigma-70 family RNA polymerase sigma factor [Phycisphaerae bacterium]
MQEQLTNISLDDTVLVERCCAGDSAAAERLIIKYQDRIFNVILKMCQNRDDAAELTQDTFVRFIENVASFRGGSSFYTWLFRIAVNLTLNYCKRRSKFGMRSLDACGGGDIEDARMQLKDYLVDADPGAPGDPAILAQKREIGEIVMQSLSKLDADHRAVLVLRDIEGMAYAEIAETLGLELGTVKSRLSRARGSLKDILGLVL